MPCERQHIHYSDKAYSLKQVYNQKCYHKVFFSICLEKERRVFHTGCEI